MKHIGIILAVLGTLLIAAATGCQSSTGNSAGKPWSFSNLLGKAARDDAAALSEDEKYDMFGEPNPDRILLSDLGPGRIGTTFKSRFGGRQNQSRGEQNFQQGQALYDEAIALWKSDRNSAEAQQLFRSAAGKFEVAARSWKNSALEQDALFMQGESSFFANDYVLANRAWEILLSRYSGTPQLDLVEARRFEIAQYWLAMKRQGAGIALNNSARPMTGLEKEARRILHRIRLDDPTGKLADDATFALANAFMEARRWSDAADAYEDLRRTYPGSRHQYLAHKFELQARLAAYRGADYDGTDLKKADQVLRTMLQQFPEESRDDEAFLAEHGGQVRHLLAERDWTMGKYYENRGENRAARHYYAQVSKNYDDTEFAGDANERIASLGGLPPVPAQRAKWLADLFPVKERNKPLIATGDRESVWR